MLDFNLLPALQREFAKEPGGWKALQASSDVSGETPRLRRAMAVMEVHAHRTAQLEEAAAEMPPMDTHAAWPDESGSRQAWRGQTHLPGTARATGEAATDPANVCDPRAEADDFLECLRRELDIDGLGDVGGGDVSDVEIQRLRHQQQSQRHRQGHGQRQDEASEGGKKAWRNALDQAAMDKIYDAAALCESRGAWAAPRVWYAAGGAAGPALRMEWAEAALLSSETTAAMAAMAVRLHAQHGFTHACATDGGKGDGPPRTLGAAAAWPRNVLPLDWLHTIVSRFGLPPPCERSLV